MNALIENARNVVLDAGNLLLTFEPEKYIPRILTGELARRLKPEMLFGTEMWPRLDEGTATEEETARYTARLYGDESVWPEVLRVIQGYQDHMEMLPLAGMIPQLHEMGKRVYLLSNYGVEPFTRAEKRFHALFSQLDGMVVSGFEKVLKPEPRIYRILLERYQLIPGECVFIDDRAENVEGARAVGMNGIVYTGPEAIL